MNQRHTVREFSFVWVVEYWINTQELDRIIGLDLPGRKSYLLYILIPSFNTSE